MGNIKTNSLNVVIPMAGLGQRFKKAGYKLPKPFIDVEGMPMIDAVVKNLDVPADYYFIVLNEHYELFNFNNSLRGAVITTNGLTEGAACSVLLAEEHIDNDTPLLIANSDQILSWDSSEFISKSAKDGSIVTFNDSDPKWSYARVENNLIKEVAEKKVISNNATSGVYYWNKGKDFVYYSKQMISKDIRVNNEFYVCPVYNEAIKDGLEFNCYHIDKMYGIGTPEDLKNYLKRNV
tara:strand:- start:95 stop:802 length:708 start_codon:yes stop_codon:yes gene_type:complete